MYATVPQPLLDGQYKPTDFLRRVPGGSPYPPGQSPNQPGSMLGGIVPPQPMMQPHSPVPQTQAPSLAQMRQMMTQLHMAQMVNRMQKHAVTHAGG